jgi:hypothetical protein
MESNRARGMRASRARPRLGPVAAPAQGGVCRT